MRRSNGAFLVLAIALAGAARGDPASPAAGAPRVVEIAARQFEFTPREITLQKDQPVTIRVASRDVTHGFYQKDLGLDLEVEPGKVAEATITPRTAGTFTIICDHFCGNGHGNMKVTAIVVDAEVRTGR